MLKGFKMKGKIFRLILFLCNLAVFCISLKLFWNMGIFVDENGTTPSAVCGGDFWLIMNWLKLALLGIATLISGIMLFEKSKK